MYIKNIISTLLFLSAAVLYTSCNKAIDVGVPLTNPASATVYTSDAKAAAVLTSIYGKMGGSGFAQGASGISVIAGLTADELQAYTQSGTSHQNYYTNSEFMELMGMWNDIYSQIYVANAALEGIANSQGGMTDSVKKQLTGEAKFMRGFLHFYLVNLWGDVPLITITDYRINAKASRTPKDQVYQQIVADLTDAKTLLPNDFKSPEHVATTERVRPTRAAASAMLARVYLYLGEWAKAETEANAVISHPRFSLVPLANAFKKNNTAAIWQIQGTRLGYNTSDGNILIRQVAPSTLEPVTLRPAFFNGFEAGDQRRKAWADSVTVATVKYYYPSKYKVKGGPATTPVDEYLNVLRLPEQYLIRAEARAKLNNLTGAKADIDTIRGRAGLALTAATTQPELLDAVMMERRSELFTEWGHRWLDLKRTGKINDVMSVVTPLKGGTWSPNWALYPLPDAEIAKNPNLLPDNPGY